MSVRVKIINGTPVSGKGLCHTCKHAKMVKGQNMEERIICEGGMFAQGGLSHGVVRFRVAECSAYHPSNQPWKWEMEEMAWTITARKKGSAGFGDAVTSAEMEYIISPPKKNSSGAPPEDTNV